MRSIRTSLAALALLVAASLSGAVNPYRIYEGGTNATSFSTLNCAIIWDGTRLACSGPLPATIAAGSHLWLKSYTASTGVFTQTQPDYSDLTGGAPLTATYIGYGSASNLLTGTSDLTFNHTTAVQTITGANPEIDLADTNGSTTKLKRTASGDIATLTNGTISAYGDQYGVTFTPSAYFGTASCSGQQNAPTAPVNMAGLTAASWVFAFKPTSFQPVTTDISGVFGVNPEADPAFRQYGLNISSAASRFVVAPNTTITAAAPTLNATNVGIVTYKQGTCAGGNGITFLFNGSASTCVDSGSAISANTASWSFEIGNGAEAGPQQVFYTGTVDTIAAWNRQLTAAEVAAIYNSGTLTSYTSWPSSGQIYRFRLDETTGSTVTDDISGTVLVGCGTYTLAQPPLWPTLAPATSPRTVITNQDGATPNTATTTIGDSNTGLTVKVKADATNIQTAAGAAGVLTAGTLNGNTFTTGTYTLTGVAGKTLTFNKSLTLDGTDSTTMTFPTTSATIARTDAGNTFTGHQTIEGVTSTGATGTGKFVFDTNPTITGASVNGVTVTGTPAVGQVPVATSGSAASWGTVSGGGGGGGGTTNYYGSMVQIGQVVTTGSASTITFSSIPAGYTDLKILFRGRATGAVSFIKVYMGLNGDTTSGNYISGQELQGEATTSAAATLTSTSSGAHILYVAGTTTATQPATAGEITIPGYSGTVLTKGFYSTSMFDYNNSNGTQARLMTGQWIATPAAISNIVLTIASGSFLDGTTATLYGSGGTSGGGLGLTGMVPIQRVITSGSQSSVSFTSIPQGYEDLHVVATARMTGAVNQIESYIKFNSDGTSGNYQNSQAIYNSTSTTAAAASDAPSGSGAPVFWIPGTGASATGGAMAEVRIGSYARATLNKTFLSDFGQIGAGSSLNGRSVYMGGWKSTAAITQIDITAASDSYLNGSVFTLYGVPSSVVQGYPVNQGTLAARPAASQNGALYFATDTQQLCLDNGSSWSCWAKTGMAQFGSTANGNTNNTNVATSIVPAGTVSATIMANSMAGGSVWTLKAKGFYGTTGTPTLQLKWKLGSTVLCDTTALTMGSGLTNQEWTSECVFNVQSTGASGSITAGGKTEFFLTGTTSTPVAMVNTTPFTVDTTANQLVDLTATWGTANASNTITADTVSVVQAQNAGGAVSGMIPIQTIVTTGSATTVTFSSIPQGYRSLKIVAQAADTSTGSTFGTATLQFNGDTGANYFWKYIGNVGTAAGQGAAYNTSGIDQGQVVSGTSLGLCQINGTGNGATSVSMCEATIPNYSATTFQKLLQSTTFGHNGASLATTSAVNEYQFYGKWASTAAITSIVITKALTAFTNGSTFTLYGIPDSIVTASPINSGTYANRPAASANGNLYFSTDKPVISRDTGSAWTDYNARLDYATVVQSPASNATCTTSFTQTFGATPTTGNIIIAMFGSSNTGSEALSQTNVTWTQLATANNGTTFRTSIWKGVVAAGAGTTLTYTRSGAGCMWGSAREISGLTGTLDTSVSVAAGTPFLPVGTIKPTVNEMVFLFGGYPSGAGAQPQIDAPGPWEGDGQISNFGFAGYYNGPIAGQPIRAIIFSGGASGGGAGMMATVK